MECRSVSIYFFNVKNVERNWGMSRGEDIWCYSLLFNIVWICIKKKFFRLYNIIFKIVVFIIKSENKNLVISIFR